MKADLHVHSTASDGTVSPAGLVRLARDRGLDCLAITDHDSVEGIPEALTAAAETHVLLIPAVELSSSLDGRDVHILGYFIDPEDPTLLGMLSKLRAARLRRAEKMVAALAEAGYTVAIDEVLALSAGGAVGRSHVARALVDAGHATTVHDAFQRMIGRDRPFYVHKESQSPTEAIATIRDAGGLAVVAHPGVNRADDLLPGMVAAGLAGIEAYHADHSPAEKVRYARMADEMGLLCTGGTDFHGPDAPNPALGDTDLPSECVERLIAAGRAPLG